MEKFVRNCYISCCQLTETCSGVSSIQNNNDKVPVTIMCHATLPVLFGVDRVARGGQVKDINFYPKKNTALQCKPVWQNMHIDFNSKPFCLQPRYLTKNIYETPSFLKRMAVPCLGHVKGQLEIHSGSNERKSIIKSMHMLITHLPHQLSGAWTAVFREN